MKNKTLKSTVLAPGKHVDAKPCPASPQSQSERPSWVELLGQK